MKKLFLSACVAALACGMADAAIVVSVTYSGTVDSGYDNTGQFGAVGDLSGASFVAKYLFDTSKGFTYADGRTAYASGGTMYGNDSPLIGASLAINGNGLVAFGGNVQSQIYTFQDPSFSEQFSGAEDNSSDVYNYVLDYSLQSFGSPSFASYDADVSTFQNGGYFSTPGAYGYLTNSHLAISSGAVPEPASWAMMVGGFGMIGGAMRRRQRTSVAFG